VWQELILYNRRPTAKSALSGAFRALAQALVRDAPLVATANYRDNKIAHLAQQERFRVELSLYARTAGLVFFHWFKLQYALRALLGNTVLKIRLRPVACAGKVITQPVEQLDAYFVSTAPLQI
jgi:hypothetical protein